MNEDVKLLEKLIDKTVRTEDIIKMAEFVLKMSEVNSEF